MNEEVLTVEEAARFLKVDPATVQRELKKGRLPGARVGRIWRISRGALTEYLAGQNRSLATALQRTIYWFMGNDPDRAIRALMGGIALENVPSSLRVDLVRRLGTLDEALDRQDPEWAARARFGKKDEAYIQSWRSQVPSPGLYFEPVNLNEEWNRVVDAAVEMIELRKRIAKARAV